MNNQKYKETLKKPEQKLQKAIHNLQNSLSEEDKNIKKCLEVLGMINLTIIKLLCKVLRKVYLDNKLIDKMEEAFRDIKKTKDEKGKTKKLNNFLKKHPEISSKMLWLMLSLAISFGSVKTAQTLAKDKKGNKKEQVSKKDSENIYTKKHTITTDKDFEDLLQLSKPLLYAELVSLESISNKAFSDNGKVKNTICVGNWKFPIDGQPTNKHWEPTSKFLKNNPKFEMKKGTHFDYIDGWLQYRDYTDKDNITVYKYLKNHLKGTSLSANELVAIISVIYNSEATMKDLCSYVKTNYDNPKKCAYYIATLKPKDSSFNKGIKKRHCHEALIYLNIDNYCSYLLQLEMNKESHSCAPTALEMKPYENMINGLKKGNLEDAKQLAKLIRTYHYKGNRKNIVSLEQLIIQNGLKDKISSLYKFEQDTISAEDSLFIQDINALYQATLNYYQNKDYQKALDGFLNIVELGYDNAGMHNDLAICYYHLGKYKKCIKESKNALQFEDINSDNNKVIKANAYFNMGLAYDTLGKFKESQECYDKAYKTNPKPIYKNKSEEAKAQQIIKSAKQKKTKNSLLGLGVLGLIGADITNRKKYKKGIDNLRKKQKYLKNPPRNRNNFTR